MGWADLGHSLQNAAQGYVAQTDEDKKRAQQLPDVQSARDYEDKRDEKQHAFEKSMEDYRQEANERVYEMHRKGELRDHILTALTQTNPPYLNPNDLDNQTAVQ